MCIGDMAAGGEETDQVITIEGNGVQPTASKEGMGSSAVPQVFLLRAFMFLNELYTRDYILMAS